MNNSNRRRDGRLRGSAVVATLALSGFAHAQVAPDAGSLLQQIEQQRKPPLPYRGAPQFAPPPTLQSLGGATVTVSSFRFAGNALLGTAELTPVVARFLNKPLDFTALQNAAIAVATAYRKAGWVVRAYLPQQDITSGWSRFRSSKRYSVRSASRASADAFQLLE